MNNDADGYEIVQVIVQDKARDLERLNSRLELCNVKVTLLKRILLLQLVGGRGGG